MSGQRCRLLPLANADGPWQMAADETLLETAAQGIASLRFYRWSPATMTLGYFQAAAECRAYPGLAELPLVRRASGGATLVHHHEVTYCLALPAGSPWQTRGESWVRRMHGIVRDALAALGISAHLATEERLLGRILCFLHQTPGDLLLVRRAGLHKVLGSAQRKQRDSLMQHGGILLAQSPHTPELPGIAELTGRRIAEEELSAVVCAELEKQLGWALEPGDWTDAERQRIAEHIAGRYGTDAWNLKR
jgi:lipoate-protein ligase A